MTQAKLKGLAAQSNQIETTLAKLNSCLHFMRESLRTGNESDVLMMKANTVQQVKELTTPFQQDVLKVIIFKFCTLTSLSPACTFGKEGSGKGQFNFPQGISCDSTGNVYVTDRNNYCIQVFTAKGKFLRMFGRCGQGKGELNTPISIAVQDGLLYCTLVKDGMIVSLCLHWRVDL